MFGASKKKKHDGTFHYLEAFEFAGPCFWATLGSSIPGFLKWWKVRSGFDREDPTDSFTILATPDQDISEQLQVARGRRDRSGK